MVHLQLYKKCILFNIHAVWMLAINGLFLPAEWQQMGPNRFKDVFTICSTSDKNKQHLKWVTGSRNVLFLFFPLILPSLCAYLSELSDRTVFSCQIFWRERRRKHADIYTWGISHKSECESRNSQTNHRTTNFNLLIT